MSKRGLQIQKKASAPVVKAVPVVKVVPDASGKDVFAEIRGATFVRLDIAMASQEISHDFADILSGVYHIAATGTEGHIKKFAEDHAGEPGTLLIQMRNLFEKIGVSYQDDPSFQLTRTVTARIEDAFTAAQRGDCRPFRDCIDIASPAQRTKMLNLRALHTRGREKDEALTWLTEHSFHLRARHRQVTGRDQIWADTLVELNNLLDREPRFDTAGHPKPWVAQAQGDVVAAMGSSRARHDFVHRLKEARSRRKSRGDMI